MLQEQKEFRKVQERSEGFQGVLVLLHIDLKAKAAHNCLIHSPAFLLGFRCFHSRIQIQSRREEFGWNDKSSSTLEAWEAELLEKLTEVKATSCAKGSRQVKLANIHQKSPPKEVLLESLWVGGKLKGKTSQLAGGENPSDGFREETLCDGKLWVLPFDEGAEDPRVHKELLDGGWAGWGPSGFSRGGQEGALGAEVAQGPKAESGQGPPPLGGAGPGSSCTGQAKRNVVSTPSP